MNTGTERVLLVLASEGHMDYEFFAKTLDAYCGVGKGRPAKIIGWSNNSVNMRRIRRFATEFGIDIVENLTAEEAYNQGNDVLLFWDGEGDTDLQIRYFQDLRNSGKKTFLILY